MAEENKTTTQGSGAIPAAAQRQIREQQDARAQSRGGLEVRRRRDGGDDLKSAASAMAGEYRDKAEQVWGDARDRARTLQEDGEQYVRENPTKAVFTALGIGFVLGLIFRR